MSPTITPVPPPTIQPFMHLDKGTISPPYSFRPSSDCLISSSDNRLCVQKTINADKLVEIWDKSTHQKLFSFESKYEVHAIAMSLDGKKLAVGEDSLINLWDINHKQLIHTLKGHTDGVWDVAFNWDGTLIASVGGVHENTVRIWNTTTGNLVRAVPGTSPIAFTAEGFLLAAYVRVETGDMRLWSLEQEKPLWIFQENELTTAVTIKPGSSILAISSVSYDGSTIQLWNMMHREHLYNLTASEGVSSLVFSPDGHTLAANGVDGTIYLWDVSFVQ